MAEEEPFIISFANRVVSTADNTVNNVKTGVDHVLRELKKEPASKVKVIETAVDDLKNTVDSVVSGGVKAIAHIGPDVMGNANHVLKQINSLVKQGVNGVKSTVQGGFDAASEAVNNVASGVGDAVSSVGQGVYDAVDSVGKGVQKMAPPKPKIPKAPKIGGK